MKKKEFSLSVFFLEIFFTWPTTKTCQAIPAAIRWKTGSVFSVPAGLCVFCLGYPVRAYVLQIEQVILAAVRTYHEIGGIRMSIADCMGSLRFRFFFFLSGTVRTGLIPGRCGVGVRCLVLRHVQMAAKHDSRGSYS